MFLDVQMPELSGFDVLRKLAYRPAVVFVTAFDKYAVRAFDEHALDYLLKPFDQERLAETLRRATTAIEHRQDSDQSVRLSALLAQLEQRPRYLERVAVKRNGRIRLLAMAEIDCLESDDNYVRVTSGDVSYLLRDSLTRFEEKLDPLYFIRVHRCAIVNVTKLEHIETSFRGEYKLVLNSGKRLTLSRSYRDNFFEKFGHGT